MAYERKEPKSIKLWSTDIKKVYLGSTKIRPSGWTPWANTVAYRPLREDANDQLGNYNWTIEWAALTYWTAWGSTIDSAFFANTRMTTSLTWAWKTLNLWVYKPSTSNDPRINDWKQIAWNINTAWNSWVMIRSEQSNNSNWKIFINLWNWDFNYAYWKDTDQWINLCLITNGSDSTKLYINWVERITTSSTWNTSNTFWLWTAPWSNVGTGDYYSWWGNISEVIIESAERTADEISDYYNNTKANYGIS